jgi:hypothetical protein
MMLSFTSSAFAQTQPEGEAATRLTSRGRVMLTGNFGGFWSNDVGSGPGSLYHWGVFASPGFLYFVRDHIGAGAFVGASYRRGAFPRDLREREASAGLRMAFEVPLGERASVMFWPWLSYHLAARDEVVYYSEGAPLEQSLRFAEVGLQIPLLFHLSSSVAFGFGPCFAIDFAMRRAEPEVGLAEFGPTLSSPPPTRVLLQWATTLLASF